MNCEKRGDPSENEMQERICRNENIIKRLTEYQLNFKSRYEKEISIKEFPEYDAFLNMENYYGGFRLFISKHVDEQEDKLKAIKIWENAIGIWERRVRQEIINPLSDNSIHECIIKHLEIIKEDLISYKNLVLEALQQTDQLTLQTIYTPEQLVKLRKALLAIGYIANINENNFIYWLSRKPLLNGMAKIKWKVSKSKAVYLLGCICVDFNFSTANKCIETKSIGLDSNNRRGKYSEIDTILETLRF